MTWKKDKIVMVVVVEEMVVVVERKDSFVFLGLRLSEKRDEVGGRRSGEKGHSARNFLTNLEGSKL